MRRATCQSGTNGAASDWGEAGGFPRYEASKPSTSPRIASKRVRNHGELPGNHTFRGAIPGFAICHLLALTRSCPENSGRGGLSSVSPTKRGRTSSRGLPLFGCQGHSWQVRFLWARNLAGQIKRNHLDVVLSGSRHFFPENQQASNLVWLLGSMLVRSHTHICVCFFAAF